MMLNYGLYKKDSGKKMNGVHP